MEPPETGGARKSPGKLVWAVPRNTVVQTEGALGSDTQMTTTSEEIVNIVDDGDMIAVVGHARLRYRLHSVIWKLRSPVLAKSIANAQKHSAPKGNRTFEVTMPKCDPQAFESLCLLFHKPKRNAFPLTVDLVLKVAFLAKRWGCLDGLAHEPDSWLEKLQLTKAWYQADSCWSLTVAALYFNNDKWFRAYSSRLIELHDASFLRFSEKTSGSFKLLKLAYALEENRHLRVTEPPNKLQFSGFPPRTANPTSRNFSEPGAVLRSENLCLQESYKKWSMEELRLADYARGERFHFVFGTASTGKAKPFQQSPPLGLCLKCFCHGKDSFKPQSGCLNCQSAGFFSQTTEAYRNVNSFNKTLPPANSSQTDILPRAGAQDSTTQSFVKEAPSMSSGSHGTSQQATLTPVGLFGSATHDASKQSTPAPRGLFGSGSNTLPQEVPAAPKGLFTDSAGKTAFVAGGTSVSKGSTTPAVNLFGSVNNAPSQQPSQPASNNLFSPFPYQSSSGSAPPFRGFGVTAPTQSKGNASGTSMPSADAKGTASHPKDTGGGFFGTSQTNNVASPKPSLFGSSSCFCFGSSGGFGSATGSTADNMFESGGSTSHTPKVNSATPAPTVAPRTFGASPSSTVTPGASNPPAGPSRGASGERDTGWLFGALSAGSNTSNKRTGSQQESDRGAKRQKQE